MPFKVCNIMELIKIYGEDTTLSEILEVRKGGNPIYKCPKCEGKGYTSYKYNAYPSGLPDSGWVEDWKYKKIECDLCKGEGYTEKEYKPKMIQDGWEC